MGGVPNPSTERRVNLGFILPRDEVRLLDAVSRILREADPRGRPWTRARSLVAACRIALAALEGLPPKELEKWTERLI